jgi:hypothetical protein
MPLKQEKKNKIDAKKDQKEIKWLVLADQSRSPCFCFIFNPSTMIRTRKRKIAPLFIDILML